MSSFKLMLFVIVELDIILLQLSSYIESLDVQPRSEVAFSKKTVILVVLYAISLCIYSSSYDQVQELLATSEIGRPSSSGVQIRNPLVPEVQSGRADRGHCTGHQVQIIVQ